MSNFPLFSTENFIFQSAIVESKQMWYNKDIAVMANLPLTSVLKVTVL